MTPPDPDARAPVPSPRRAPAIAPASGSPPPSAGPWLKTVILHHQIPPRASAGPRLPSDPRLAVEIAAPADHFDWLIETPYPPGTTPTDDDRTLLCFRCAQRPDILIARGEPFTAERLADHRRLYLHYEGELSDNRGTVKRVAKGLVLLYMQNSDCFWIETRFAGDGYCILAVMRLAVQGASWRFTPEA